MDSLIDVSPEKYLNLKGPFDTKKGTESTILIHNKQGKSTITFKIGSSEPEKYRFSPEYGTIQANKSQIIRILLLPYMYSEDEKNTHRIIISAMVFDESATLIGDAESFWKTTDRAPGKMITEQILAIALEPTETERKKGQRNLARLNKLHQTNGSSLDDSSAALPNEAADNHGSGGKSFLVHATTSKMKPRKMSGSPNSMGLMANQLGTDDASTFSASPMKRGKSGSTRYYYSKDGGPPTSDSSDLENLQWTLNEAETDLETAKRDRALLRKVHRKTDKARDDLKIEYTQLLKHGVRERLKTMYAIQVFTLVCLIFGISYALDMFLMKYVVGKW